MSDSVTEVNLVYKPQGAHRELWASRSKIVCIYGPAGTGKTRTELEKIYAICEKYPKARVLIARQTRESMNETVLVTWEDEVLPFDHYCLDRNMQRRMRDKYTFSNGSEIILGGLDKPTKILSGQYDHIYIPEAIETNEGDIETLLTRLRNFKTKYHQLVLDTNPGAINHWLKQRHIRGGLELIKTTHKDNPRYWNEVLQEWTEEGLEYVIGTLGLMTGQRRQKYFIGEWGFAEGVVYSDYNSELTNIDRCVLPDGTRFFASVDFGFNDPFFFGIFALTPRKNLVLIKYIYMSRKVIEEHIVDIDNMFLETTVQIARYNEKTNTTEIVEITPMPEKIIMDTNNKGEGIKLARHLNRSRVGANKKSITDNIDLLSTALQNCGTDRPAFYIYKDALYEVDLYLKDERNHPTTIQEEFTIYTWKKDPSGTIVYDIPIDKYNHALNGCEYMVQYTIGSLLSRRTLRAK